MIAKINRAASLYGALIYNQNKVGENSAQIISGHRMICDTTGNPENVMQKTMLSFDSYLRANRNTEKPILHISLNPSLDDNMTNQQFVDLAADYMGKMGYGDQPYIVYLHEDIGRRHIHIVSTCVDENGVKISDSYEKRRSMQACRELELKFGLANATEVRKSTSEISLQKVDYKSGDMKRQISNILKRVNAEYKFQSFGEYSALLSCFNIDAKLIRGGFNGVPYTGIVYTATNDKGKVVGLPFKSSLFGKEFGHEELTKRMQRHAVSYKQKKWSPKISDTVRLAMLSCGGKRKNFVKTMQNKGVDVIFRDNDAGRLYGVTFIDHNSREVYNGSRLGKDFSANAFETLFNSPAQAGTINQDQSSQQSLTSSFSEDKAAALENTFGISLGEALHDDSLPEDEFIRPSKRKIKKKKRSRGVY